MISICYPAFNEEENIEHVLSDTLTAIEHSKEDFEIIVVNDGSSDKTSEKVMNYSQIDNRVKLVDHTQNLGYAMATKTCLESAHGDIVFVIDSDRQHDVKDIFPFIDAVNDGYDVVVGWKVNRQDPFGRILMSRVYNWLFRVMFRVQLHDVDCGFRCFSREVIPLINIEYLGVPVGPEIFAKAVFHNLKIKELPVQHYKRPAGKSLFRPWLIPIIVFKTVRSLFKLKSQLRKKEGVIND